MTGLDDLIQRMRERAADPEYQRRLAEAEKAEKERRAMWIDTCRRKAFAKTGIPVRVLALIDAGLEQTEPLNQAMSSLDAKPLLFLSGPCGCGKTVAACNALVSYIRISDDGYALPSASGVGRFVKALDLVRAGTFDETFWRSLRESPFLVIDDLGCEPLDDKGWALANIAALIDARYDAQARTIITTNLDAEKFKERYGASDGGRLVDRLRESAAFVQFDGGSMRGGA